MGFCRKAGQKGFCVEKMKWNLKKEPLRPRIIGADAR
jgi:hypothetical protein